jgi:hypothetical protein
MGQITIQGRRTLEFCPVQARNEKFFYPRHTVLMLGLCRGNHMRVFTTIALLAAMAASLSACAVADAGGAVISVASSAVSTTADLTGEIICLVCENEDDR